MKGTFDQLYDKYHKDLFQFLIYLVGDRNQAEDLIQEVYLKVLKSYDTFKGESSEKTWLFSVARYTAIDYFRKQQTRRKKITDFFDWGKKGEKIKDTKAMPEEVAVLNSEMQLVYQCLDKCTADQKSVVVLRFIQSFSIEETADILGWSTSKVKTTQHRAIKALRDFMTEFEVEEERVSESRS